MLLFLKDATFWIYLIVLLLILSWFLYFNSYEKYWWENIYPLSPSWGNSESLVMTIYFLYLTSVSYSLFKISKNIKSNNVNNIHGLFLLNSILAFGVIDSLRYNNNSYTEAFYYTFFQTLISIVTAYISWQVKNEIVMLSLILSFISIVYMNAWTHTINNNN